MAFMGHCWILLGLKYLIDLHKTLLALQVTFQLLRIQTGSVNFLGLGNTAILLFSLRVYAWENSNWFVTLTQRRWTGKDGSICMIWVKMSPRPPMWQIRSATDMQGEKCKLWWKSWGLVQLLHNQINLFSRMATRKVSKEAAIDSRRNHGDVEGTLMENWSAMLSADVFVKLITCKSIV